MTLPRGLRALLLGATLLVPPLANGQGCTQCLDQTRATPPSVQAGYRHAIELMAGVATGLFLAGAWLLRRER